MSPTQTMPKVKLPKRKMSNSTKTALAVVLGLLTVLLAWFLLDLSGKNRITKIYNEKIKLAADPTTTEVPMDSEMLETFLKAATSTGMVEARQTVYQGLYLAKATDGTDIDARIAEFATTREMMADVREVLIRDVLRRRKNPAVVPVLLAYASRPGLDSRSAIAALQAVRFMVGDEQVEHFLGVLQGTSNNEVRTAAEETIAEILKKSARREQLAERLADAYGNATTEVVRHSLLRLLGRCGGEKALEIVKKALDQPENRIAAIVSIAAWRDETALPLLYSFISGSTDLSLRARAFDAAAKFAADRHKELNDETTRGMWEELAKLAKATEEQLKVIRGLYNYDTDWAIKMLEAYRESDNDQVAGLADKALIEIEDRRRVRGQDGGE